MSYELTDYEKQVARKYLTYRTAHEVIREELQIFKANECQSLLPELWCRMLETALPNVEAELANIEYRYIRLRKTEEPMNFDVFIGSRHSTIWVDLTEMQRNVEDLVRRWGTR